MDDEGVEGTMEGEYVGIIMEGGREERNANVGVNVGVVDEIHIVGNDVGIDVVGLVIEGLHVGILEAEEAVGVSVGGLVW